MCVAECVGAIATCLGCPPEESANCHELLSTALPHAKQNTSPQLPCPPVLHLPPFCSIAVGLGLGWAVAKLLRTPRQFKPHVVAAIAFGNVGNLVRFGPWGGV